MGPQALPRALYHFTSGDRVKAIKRDGLTLGMVILPPPYAPAPYRLGDALPRRPDQPPGTQAFAAFTGQWLTDDPDFRQAWATRALIPDDRTAWRVRVRVPREVKLLVRWSDFVREQRLDQKWPLWLDDFEGRTLDDDGGAYGRRPDPGRWWVYLAPVPPEWLDEWTARPASVDAQEVG